MQRRLLISATLISIFLLLGVWYYPAISNQEPRIEANSYSADLVTFQGVAMTMPYRVSVEAPLSPKQRQDCEAAIAQAFHRIDTVFNHWNPKSQISAFNASQSTELITIEPDLFVLLERVNEISQMSHGLYDPTIMPLCKLWRSYLKEGQVPPKELCEQLDGAVGWDQIQLVAPNKLRKANPGIQLDLSSIAKGTAVDLICERLQALGYKHLFIEWAGEIRVAGGHPKNRDWVIGIKTPRKSDYSFLAKIEMKEGAIATSGHDELFWVAEDENGEVHTYSHFLHPRTRMPLFIENRIILSCTVLAPSCGLADGLATAGLLFSSIEEAQVWATEAIQKWPEISIFFFTKDQQLWHFSGKNSKSHRTVESINLYKPLQV